MSQFVLDDQLDVQILIPALAKWTAPVRLQELRPREHVFDDRVPEILRTLQQPTFLTIDHGFWNRELCHPKYCILYFECSKDEQETLPKFLLRLLHLKEFPTRSSRMGKVARINRTAIEYWEFGIKGPASLPFAKR